MSWKSTCKICTIYYIESYKNKCKNMKIFKPRCCNILKSLRTVACKIHSFSFSLLQQRINIPFTPSNSKQLLQYYTYQMQIHTFCTANGSLCSWSRYFSKLKKVSKNMWAIRQRFKSPRVILPGENNTYTNTYTRVRFRQQGKKDNGFPIKRNTRWASTGTNLDSQVWPGRASGRANPGRAEVRCPSFPSSHTVPRRNTPTQTWTGRHRHPCPCSGTSTLYWRDEMTK